MQRLQPTCERGITTGIDMESGRLKSHRFRFDGPQGTDELSGPHISGTDAALARSIQRTRSWLLDQQKPEGHWEAPLEGDSILESETILLLTFLENPRPELMSPLAEAVASKQQTHGGWSLVPGGSLDISASVKAYWSLKLCGWSPELPAMIRAREAILAHGGAERVNSYTRFYMAMLGLVSYYDCPAVPPELLLLPRWSPVNLTEMSAWTRTIVVPLSLVWAAQPVTRTADRCGLDELFASGRCALPRAVPRDVVDPPARQSWVPWRTIFEATDRLLKWADQWNLRPGRELAVRKARAWLTEHAEHSDGLGAIYPPIVWTLVALRGLGCPDDDPLVVQTWAALEKLFVWEHGRFRVQPCQSPVWDTAIATIALRDAGVAADAAALQRAADWLLDREIRQRGDWAEKVTDVEPSGWCFEYRNAYYPDVDDTSMVLMALAALAPGDGHADWLVEYLSTPTEVRTVVSGRTMNPRQALGDIERVQRLLAAIARGTRWMLAMQCRNGGWGAFDVDNTRELLTRVPFADHNAMIDPPTADITARVLESLGKLGIGRSYPAVPRALDFIQSDQQSAGCWLGRWGVNYIYGTWQVVQGLEAIGVPANDPLIEQGVDWLLSRQNPDGGWGETIQSYSDQRLAGVGPSTASQTAWGLLALIAGGLATCDAARRAAEYLMNSQSADGQWHEPEFTGTGFPKVFYLRYDYYRISFPLMALSRYRRALRGAAFVAEA